MVFIQVNNEIMVALKTLALFSMEIRLYAP